MLKNQILDSVVTPDGRELVLYQHGTTFAIRVDDDDLMSSRMHGSEESWLASGYRPLARCRRRGSWLAGLAWVIRFARCSTGSRAGRSRRWWWPSFSCRGVVEPHLAGGPCETAARGSAGGGGGGGTWRSFWPARRRVSTSSCSTWTMGPRRSPSTTTTSFLPTPASPPCAAGHEARRRGGDLVGWRRSWLCLPAALRQSRGRGASGAGPAAGGRHVIFLGVCS